MRPYRSILYMPATNARAIEKARTLACDALVLDLEDAVAPEAKEAARQGALHALAQGNFGAKACLVRLNGCTTPASSAWAEADCAAQFNKADGLVLPKVNTPADVDWFAQRLPTSMPLWCMIETPLGVLNASAIAAHPRVSALMAGTSDLSAELQIVPGADRLGLLSALSLIVLAARAHQRLAFDGVHLALEDEQGLALACAQGRALGFDGKTLIHPSQIAAANQAFLPSPAQIEHARALIAAYAQARAQGQGVAVYQGKLVENLHVAQAEQLLRVARMLSPDL
jgi:citrate lyase beta subunit